MYAQLSSDGKTVENVVVADASFAAEEGLGTVPDYVGVGWTTDGTSWTAPIARPDPDEQAWQDFTNAVNSATSLADLQKALTGDSGFRLRVHQH